jgi:hypothetical protein
LWNAESSGLAFLGGRKGGGLNDTACRGQRTPGGEITEGIMNILN